MPRMKRTPANRQQRLREGREEREHAALEKILSAEGLRDREREELAELEREIPDLRARLALIALAHPRVTREDYRDHGRRAKRQAEWLRKQASVTPHRSARWKHDAAVLEWEAARSHPVLRRTPMEFSTFDFLRTVKDVTGRYHYEAIAALLNWAFRVAGTRWPRIRQAIRQGDAYHEASGPGPTAATLKMLLRSEKRRGRFLDTFSPLKGT